MSTANLENTIESSLLCIRDNQTEFVHETFLEYFLAKWFSDRINGGILTVHDAYLKFWTYSEDKKLWGLETLPDDVCRAILPTWRSILLNIASMLERNQRKNLIRVIETPFHHASENLGSRNYNPFEVDYDFCFKLASFDEALRDSISEKVIDILLASHESSTNISSEEVLVRQKEKWVQRFELLGVYYPRILQLLYRGHLSVQRCVHEAVYRMGRFEEILYLTASGKEEDRVAVRMALLTLGIDILEYNTRFPIDKEVTKTEIADFYSQLIKENGLLIPQLTIVPSACRANRIDIVTTIAQLENAEGLFSYIISHLSEYHEYLKPKGYNPSVKRLAA